MNIQTPEVLAPAEIHIDQTKLVAFDGCHKIYMAVDEEAASWFRGYYPHIVEGNRSEMLKAVIDWYAESCDLKFVNGARGEDLFGIVEQFADDEEEEECWFCGSPWCEEECQDEEE